MVNSKVLKLLVLGVVLLKVVQCQTFEIRAVNSNYGIQFNNEDNDLELTVNKGSANNHKSVVKNFAFREVRAVEKGVFYFIASNQQFNVKIVKDEPEQFLVQFSFHRLDYLRHCVDLDPENLHWYGGPQQKVQYWPIEKLRFNNYSYVTKEADNCGVAERYWLNSDGLYYFISDEVPLFLNQDEEQLCFVSQRALPYNVRTENFIYEFWLGVSANARTSHNFAVFEHLGRPRGTPDHLMALRPIWSTWARYKREINESVILEFADEILENNFTNSQFEIDDAWEVCYGALTFNKNQFPDIKGLVQKIKSRGFRVTLWIHPFINKGCDPWHSEALEKGYLVRNYTGSTETQWWNSETGQASYVDFTNPKATKWYIDRLKALQKETNIDSFKFDAGETSWTPSDPQLQAKDIHHPLVLTKRYIDAVAQFGPVVEVRSGFKNQHNDIYTRIIDKDTLWTWNNGLPTLITTTLQLNMNGYPFVLPDMIGGNGYDGPPEAEIFIRWLQANTFMPSLQFSFVPWDFNNQTVTELSRLYVSLHEAIGFYILERFDLVVRAGQPVNPPIWWIDPTDRVAQGCSDEFLLGDAILIAPVLEEGASQRDIYLPRGQWVDGNTGEIAIGPTWIRNYPAPLHILPFFFEINSNKRVYEVFQQSEFYQQND